MGVRQIKHHCYYSIMIISHRVNIAIITLPENFQFTSTDRQTLLSQLELSVERLNLCYALIL